MELSVHYIDFLPGAPDRLASDVAQAAAAAEEAGATMFTLADHFFQMEGIASAQDPFLEVFSTLGFLAGKTRSIALAPLVTGVTYRHPDIWNATTSNADELAHKIRVLYAHCENVGRDPADIRLTAAMFSNPFDDVDGWLRTAHRYAELGIEQINAGPLPGDPDPVGFVKRLGDDIIPRLIEFG